MGSTHADATGPRRHDVGEFATRTARSPRTPGTSRHRAPTASPRRCAASRGCRTRPCRCRCRPRDASPLARARRPTADRCPSTAPAGSRAHRPPTACRGQRQSWTRSTSAPSARSDAGEIGVAAVDVERVEHGGLAVGGQPREHQRRAGAHVERAYRRRRQPVDPADHRVATFVADVGTHAVQLGHEPEAVVEHVLGDDGRAVGGGEQRDHERHEVGGEARERERGDVDRAEALVGPRPQAVGRLRHLEAHLGELHDHGLDVVDAGRRATWPRRRRCHRPSAACPSRCGRS